MNPDDIRSIHPVSRETLGRLKQFVTMVQKWSRAINLVAPSTLDDVWRRHVADSLQIYALNPGPLRWLDLGSGAGFPGLVTAIMLAETDGGHVDLVESNHKKAAFLRSVLIETGARGTVHPIRIDAAPPIVSGIDALSARALATLDNLLAMGEPWLAEGATAWWHKGRDYRSEVAIARRSWRFDLVEHVSRVDAASVVLQISNVRPLHPVED